MTPISSINQFLINNRRLQFNSLTRTQEFKDFQNSILDNIQKAQVVPTNIDLINQLPHDQVDEVTNIFRSINILANQSLELGQDFENKENLQAEVEEDISEARALFDEFTQDDLTLFISIFQNQLTRGFLDSSRTSSNSVSDLSFDGISNDLLESLFNINVLSESGSLSALDLTGSIIDNFTGNNNSNFLEFLLDDLSSSFIGSNIFTSLLQTKEPEEAETSSGTKTSQDIDTDKSITNLSSINSPDSNPPTIIELAG
jgi:hypothetical protein